MGRPESPLVGLQRYQQSSTFQDANDRKMQMYQVSIGRITLTLGFLVFISTVCSGKATNTSDFGGCMYAHYMVNETCIRCPDNCTICVSDTNCTLCRKGFYGQVCENKCDFNCTGTCHQEYGHCTYGCPDGTYPADDNSCQPCLSMCSLCASKSHCIDCKRSHFLDAGQCRSLDSTERTRSATFLAVVTIPVIVIFIVIAVLLVRVLYKRRYVIKKKNTNDTELSTLENVDLTIPLSTKDACISSLKTECIVGKDTMLPKSTSEHNDDDDDDDDDDDAAADDDISDLDPNAEIISQCESDISGLNLSEESGTVPLPEPETSEIHTPQDDGNSYLNTGTMPSEFGAQLKPYDTLQLSPTEIFSGIRTPPNRFYQDSHQRVLENLPTKTKTHVPYTRHSRDILLKENLASKVAQQIADDQPEHNTYCSIL